MRYLTLALLLVSLAGCSGISSEKSGCAQWDSASSIDPFELLKNSMCFRIGGVGAAAATPPEEIALRRLMAKKGADEVLQKLFIEGSPAGQLYALFGLRSVAPTDFDRIAAQLKPNNTSIWTQGGCIVYQMPMNEIVQAIKNGQYDIYMKRKI